MTWTEAAAHQMPFGKFRRKRLDKIAEDDEGLLYLDWLVGQEWVKGRLRDALEIYLADESIQSEIKVLVDRRG